jgi:small subunit ribosomal protein S3
MGHKVNPRSFRLQVDKNWQSRWFASKGFATNLVEDLNIRKTVEKQVGKRASVAEVVIERSPNAVNVQIFTAKPGVVIGRGGSGIEELKKVLAKQTKSPIKISIEEVKRPETSAVLVAENIASQLERRIGFRRAMKMTAENSMKSGIKGIKIGVSGRLNGAEMARREKISLGSVPLHTLRADIDYGFALAHTTYGVIGVKVWIYKGDRF